MTIAALSTAGFSQYIAASSNMQKSQAAWQSLQQSLASGNLTAAQSAFNTYKLDQNLPAAGGSSSGAGSRLSTDMTALGSAIGSGDLAASQKAFAIVQSDLKTTPSQAMDNAAAAAAQTVQWVDDLLSVYGMSRPSSTRTDPAFAILASSMGLDSYSENADPTFALLESKYGAGASGSSASGTVAGSGNAGSSASVNAYA